VKTKRASKLQDKLVESIFYQHCRNMPISILRIPKLYAMARRMLDSGATDQEVGKAMVEFIQTE
jgi:hypothetical protein